MFYKKPYLYTVTVNDPKNTVTLTPDPLDTQIERELCSMVEYAQAREVINNIIQFPKKSSS